MLRLLRYKWRTGVGRVVFRLDAGQIDLVGVAPAAAFLPDQVQLRQLLKRRCNALLANAQFPGQLFAREDHKDLAVVIDPAVPAGELEAVEQEGIGYLGVQAHIRIAGIGEQPAGHLHVVDALHIRLLHQGKGGALFHFRCLHGHTSIIA